MALGTSARTCLPFLLAATVLGYIVGTGIGGSGMDLRSKARTLSGPVSDPSKLPKWNYDGSSTGQAPTEDSEVILYPQAIFKDPFRRGNNILARILALNASYFLKNEGHFVISIKENCIDSTVPTEAVFAQEVKKLQQEQFKPEEQVTLEPFERDHACVVGGYRMPKKSKVAPSA